METRSALGDRRRFLKSAATGITTVLLGDRVLGQPVEYTSAWSPAKQINPAISNMRVVNCTDPAMIRSSYKDIAWRSMPSQNAAADEAVVHANLDAMAMALTDKRDAAAAWATAFQKPAAKRWDQVRVAIKVNGIGSNHPRLTVVDKLAKELNRLGVLYSDIVIYDGTHNAWGKYESFVGNGLASGIVVSNRNDRLTDSQGRPQVLTPVPFPYGSLQKCTAAIADGTIDILINCAVNKSHEFACGRATLTMKNHLGTFEPEPAHSPLAGKTAMDYIVAVNMSAAIIGGAPPRQQLCLVDSLWSSTSKGPTATPDHDTASLSMGVFGPAVDHLVIPKIREQVMGATHATEEVDRLLTAFGYKTSEPVWVEVKPAAS